MQAKKKNLAAQGFSGVRVILHDSWLYCITRQKAMDQ